MPIVEMVGASRQDADTKQASTGRLVNYYRERLGDRFVLRCVPGMQGFADTNKVLGRAIQEVAGQIYAVSGGSLFSVDATGTAQNLGSVTDDAATTMAGYDNNVLIAAGGTYYVWDGSTLSGVGSGAFTDVGSVCFVSGYGVLTEDDGDRFEWTTLRAPGTRNATHVARAEARDDVILRGLELAGNLYLFGKRSYEIWALTGLAGASAFGRISGTGRNRGILARSLACSMGDALGVVGDDGVVYVVSGMDMVPVSAAPVNRAIEDETPTNLFYYEHEGHKFLVLRFENRPAWVYDLTTQEWHERADRLGTDAWDGVGAAKAFNRNLVLSKLGTISQCGGQTDNGETLVRKVVTDTVEVDGRRFTVPVIEARTKLGYAAGTVTMRLSRDRGATWGTPKDRAYAAGNYQDRLVWRSQGLFRTLTAEFSQSDDTDAPLFADVRIDVA